jgi:hypothetical protein
VDRDAEDVEDDLFGGVVECGHAALRGGELLGVVVGAAVRAGTAVWSGEGGADGGEPVHVPLGIGEVGVPGLDHGGGAVACPGRRLDHLGLRRAA